MNSLRIVMLGPPASGKGTHGRTLAQSLGLEYLSTGALLRQHVQVGSPIGIIAAPILADGRYLPDEVMCEMMEQWLTSQHGGWVLDGFPRSVPQADFLQSRLAQMSQQVDIVVGLKVPLEELTRRIVGRLECSDCRWSGQIIQTAEGICPSCGGSVFPRSDDHLQNFLSRHREFERLTRPVMDYYQKQGRLLVCDATPPREEVSQWLLERVRGFSSIAAPAMDSSY